jgi:hypothetical protein
LHSNGTCQDSEWPPNSTINRLPDEVLLEIFDSYRQGTGFYNHRWKEKYAWFNLTHVCRKWRAVMSASSSRLDLGITVGPKKPGHIETILSGPWPIVIDYKRTQEYITGSALWRLRAALRHHDRVREISFEGSSASFGKFFKATNRPFPVLENLSLHFRTGDEVKLPDTFLRGPDLSVSHLRRLRLNHVSLTSASGFLSSVTALTHLYLVTDSSETTLLACLKGVPCLRGFDLSPTRRPSDSMSQPLTPKDKLTLSNLTSFRYIGNNIFLDALVAGFSAPSLQDVALTIEFSRSKWPPIVHLPRFINGIEGRYDAVHVAFLDWGVRFSFLPPSESLSHCEPHFEMVVVRDHSPPELILYMSGVLSAMLTTVKELYVTFDGDEFWRTIIPWPKFYRHFPSVKALRTDRPNGLRISRTFPEESGRAFDFLPALEEIEIERGTDTYWNFGRNFESVRETQLAAFRPFVSARQQVGRPVNVFYPP